MPEVPNEQFPPNPPPPLPRFPLPPRRPTNFATRGLIASSIGVGIGFGTCGLGGSNVFTPEVNSVLFSIGFLLFFASLLSIVIFGIILIVQSSRGSFRR